MHRMASIRVGIVIVLVAVAACRSHPQSWPTEPADLTGQVVEVRSVRAMGGMQVTDARSNRDAPGTGDIQRLRIRVIGSRSAAPGTQAYVGVDGITTVARNDASAGSVERPELEGAFVRIWFRGVPQKSTPTELSAMARVMAIDSLVTVAAKQ
jgi:hypothetical protein